MLQSIRDRSQGWLTGAIVGLICITFAFWGVHTYLGQSGTPAEVVAKVNGSSIHLAELNATYQRLRQQQQMQLGAAFVIDQKMEMELKKQALNQLIMNQVLANAAARDGFRVTGDEVGAALLSVPVFQVDGQFSRERFNEVLSNILYTENAFLADLRTTMLVNQARSGIIDSAFALSGDISSATKLINQKRDFGYLTLPVQSFLNGVHVTDEQALAYYQQHQNQFTTPEQVSVEYIELSLSQLAAKLQFSDEQLKQFYQNNLSNYTLPERWHVAHILIKVPPNALPQQVLAAQNKADAIVQRLKAGDSFAQLAQTNSADAASVKNGGVLDWFSAGMADSAFEKAAAALKQVGDVSAPVRTKYGFSIIKLIGHEQPQVMPFAKAREQVNKALAQQQAEQVFAENSDKLSNLTYANPTSLEVAAKALNLPVQTTGLFSRQGGRDQITANPKVAEGAFNADVLQGNNSDVISLDPDTLVVLRVKQHVATALQTFDKVKDQVIQLLKTQAAQQQAEIEGKKLLQQLQQGNKGEEIAKQMNLPWQVANNVGRFDPHVPSAVLNAAFRLPRPNAQPAVGSFKLPNGNYALVSVNKVIDGTLGNNPAAQERIYREELEDSFGQLDYSLYVHNVLNKSKINIKNKKWAESQGSESQTSENTSDY